MKSTFHIITYSSRVKCFFCPAELHEHHAAFSLNAKSVCVGGQSEKYRGGRLSVWESERTLQRGRQAEREEVIKTKRKEESERKGDTVDREVNQKNIKKSLQYLQFSMLPCSRSSGIKMDQLRFTQNDYTITRLENCFIFELFSLIKQKTVIFLKKHLWQ